MLQALSIKKISNQLARDVKQHGRLLQKAGVRALNKTATTVRKNSSVEVRKVLNLKASLVKKQLGIKKANAANPVAQIQSMYKPVPAVAFNGVRQTKKGVSVKMRKDKSRHLFKGAFIRIMPNGHKGVFKRSSKATRRTKGRPSTSSANLKVSELHGPSVQAVFAESLNKLVAQGDPILDKNLSREIDYALSKK